jgi:N-acetyl-anhydromuramyl-L-alanine amidase AmpD
VGNGMMLPKTIEAFQYHFRPQNYDGIMDAETWAILQALNQNIQQNNSN